MENSYQYFCNRECQYFPCHEGVGERFNCLFCYCPLYALGDQCGGNFVYLPSGIKSCEHCTLPHSEGGYAYVMRKIGQIIEKAKK